jgi:nucleoside-diphosphate-sugar epimerase
VIKNRLLITGSSGLIGTALGKFLQRRGVGIIGADIRAAPGEQKIDIRDTARLAPLLAGVTGIIHLAAVSRVVDGQRDPALCRAVNVDATRGILNAALASPHRPWVIYASSREVYGHQDVLPVGEDAAYGPLNIYARTKMNAELLVGQARDAGLQTSVVRFSTVYGSVADHADRVIPAFASAAMRGGVLRVDGGDCFLDPTHVDDVVVGLARIIDKLISGEKKLPAIHLVSGQRATLLELAELANEIGGNRATINFAPARSFDVHGFVGNPKRAETLLGWRTTTRLRDGLSRLMNEFADAQPVA